MPPIVIPTSEDVLEGLRTDLRDALAGVQTPVDLDAVEPGTALLSLPLDSLALMELMTRVEDRFRVFVPEERAFAFETVQDVIDFVRAGVQKKADRASAVVSREHG